jgi:hypothetical protein
MSAVTMLLTVGDAAWLSLVGVTTSLLENV